MANRFHRTLRVLALAAALGSPAHAESPEAEKAFMEGCGAQWNQKSDEAIAAFTRAIALEPKYVLAYCNRASTYQSVEKLDLALVDANHAVELAPKFGGAYLIRGGIYLDRREPAKAVADLTRSIERRPLAMTFQRRGEACFALGQYELAIKDFTQVVSPVDMPEPQDMDLLDRSTAALDLAKEQPYYFRALAEKWLGRMDEALADFHKAAAASDLAAAAPSQASAPDGGKLAQTVNDYVHALADEPSDDGAYFTRSSPGFAQHDLPAALANLNTKVAQNPGDAQARIDRGYAEFKLNHFDGSVKDNTQSLNARPNNPSAYNNRGLVYLTIGDYDRAIEDYNAVLRVMLGAASVDAHRQALAYCGLGKALGLKGDDINAKVAFNLAVKAAPDLALVYRFRADYEAALGHDAAALDDYAHALQLNPQSAEALAGRAWTLATTDTARLRNPADAIADATKANDLTAWTNPDFLGILAAANAAAADFDSAVKWQIQAVSILDAEPDKVGDTEARRLLALYRDHKPYAAPQ